ncbi:iron ABC transporter permease [Peribacillus psychrosaccharolyticus]|uniref:Iron ABC transporter permease n=1 Tax=Peribacillus psychrosaccharolyticus TaxID=1407 RepID=A0A974NP80_PERPY|nr:iron ABC transporter permease [Peribacillus psychrosaccharolyticus]MEC2054159.1 iron ABC transporter permease [Peribacillus psychrosaccharolyticus]MED3742223.1 iron ABC transporter permease [Peribacillus psychrosaccharolyticus]QQT01208.1 iron ABC transporter permease [Peribacillus psychrosaccharolyticus]
MKASYTFLSKMLLSLILLFFIVLIALGYGAASTSFQDMYEAVIGKSGGQYYNILREIRFPRVIAAFFVGAALAVAGAIMQGMTRNPLAEPGLLGLTAGANLALSLALAFIPGISFLMIMFSSFIGAGIGMLSVLGISSTSRNGLSPLKLVLAGAAVSLFLQAIASSVSILFNVAKNVSMWTAGGLISTSWDALIIVPFIMLGLFIAILYSKQLTILSLNEELAKGLGQKTKLIKIILIFVVIILAGTAVALIGNLTFVGLFIPHIVRKIVGADYRFIIPMSIIVGGIFMIGTDFISRMVIAPLEIPVVALVALVGLPFFLFLVKKGGRTFFA